MKERPVYSTATGSVKKESKAKESGYNPSDGPTKLRLETKGRGGKSVTVLFHLPFPEKDAKRLMKDLAALLGVGSTFKNGTIELRGDVRGKVEEFYAQKGWKIVRAGG